MEHDDTLAARMRAEYVGDDAIAFDELKPEVRARWERVAAVAPAPIRVPFSAAQIEAMAKAAFAKMHPSSKWEFADRGFYSDAIRAALAAGGLEPCAVPDTTELHALRTKVENQRKQLRNLERREESRRFAALTAAVPEDVALRPAYLHITTNEIAFLIWNAMHEGMNTFEDDDAPRARRAAELIMELLASKQTPIASVPERASDEELGRILVDARSKFTGSTATYDQLIERGQELIRVEAAAVRARVEAPLLAEIERLTAERDIALETTERVCAGNDALLAERDTLAAELTALKVRIAPHDEQRHECWRLLNKANMELCPTTNLAHAVKEFIEKRDAIATRVAELEVRGDKVLAATVELNRKLSAELEAANRRVAELEAEMNPHVHVLNALRAELEAAKIDNASMSERDEILVEDRGRAERALDAKTRELEAALAERADKDAANVLLLRQLAALRQPVDPDAWKTPLEIEALGYRGQSIGSIKLCPGDKDAQKIGCTFHREYSDKGWQEFQVSAQNAASLAQWLASYAAAHGCPVSLPATETHLPRLISYDNDELGRMVRHAWVEWAKEQPNPKPSWLLPYDELSEADKEADRRIGEHLLLEIQKRLDLVPKGSTAVFESVRPAPETRPVKVGWDVTPCDVKRYWYNEIVGTDDAAFKLLMDYLAAHAVLPVPAGVPSVDDLITIYVGESGARPNIDAVTAIRNATLDGVGQGDLLDRAGKAEAFKVYVHKRLDDAGVPANPEPPVHALEGCRVGDRLDWLIGRIPTPHEPTDAEVEALARALFQAPDQNGKSWVLGAMAPEQKIWFENIARAAFAHIGKPSRSNAEMQVCINRKNRRIDTLKACVRKWKAKAAPATPIKCIFCDYEATTLAGLRGHSAKCEKHPLWTAPIASAGTLEQLAEIAKKSYKWRVNVGDDWESVVTAILRAAKARVDVTPHDLRLLHAEHNDSSDWFAKALDWCNSRIVYGVAVPEEDIFLEQIPGKDMTVGACVTLLESTRKNLDRATRALERAGFQDHGAEDWRPPIGPEPRWYHSGPTRAEAESKLRELRHRIESDAYMVRDYVDFVNWLLPQLPDERAGMPSAETLGRTLYDECEEHKNIYAYKDNVKCWTDVAAAALTALRPWLRTPTGWELGVTEQDIASIIENHPLGSAPKDVLDLINSRIHCTPTGWELDVTAEDIEAVWKGTSDYSPNYEGVLDLCRSRIRSTFGPCPECATWRATYERDKAGWDERASRAVRALEGE